MSEIFELSEGDSLSELEAATVVRTSASSIILVAGMARCGKTTLVAGLYGLFHKRPFASLTFSGSLTLPGFERRSHLARLSSGRDEPDTARTGHSEEQHLLHLQLVDQTTGNRCDLLFTDLYGEAFRRAADSAEECSRVDLLKRADHIVLLVDGRKAVNKAFRQEAFMSVDALLGQCIDTGMLGLHSTIQVVVTKHDVVSKASTEDKDFVERKTSWICDRYGPSVKAISVHKVALRSANGTKTGFGMDSLLALWLPKSSIEVNVSRSVPGTRYTEFDRFDGQHSGGT